MSDKVMSTLYRLLFSVLLLLPVVGFAQLKDKFGGTVDQLDFSGMVVDSISGKPIEHAVVSFVYPNTTQIKNVITNQKGEFKGQLHYTGGIHFEIACMGYKVLSFPLIVTDAESFLGKFKLAPDIQQLDEVVVRARMAMYRVKGDTIIYFPQAVKTLQGDAVLDILRQMPGVEVGKDGAVSIDGKPVERSYVNSRLVFGLDPKLAVTKIAADDVSQIMAYDEADERDSLLVGKEAARKRKVINILTFSAFEEVATGNVRAEAGGTVADDEWDSYLAAGDAGLFQEKRQLQLLGQVDNFNPEALPQHGHIRDLSLGAKLSGIPQNNENYNVDYEYKHSNTTASDRQSSYYFPTEQYQSQQTEQLGLSFNRLDQHRASGRYSKARLQLSGSYSLTDSDGGGSGYSEIKQDDQLLTSIDNRSFAYGRKQAFNASASYNTSINNKNLKINFTVYANTSENSLTQENTMTSNGIVRETKTNFDNESSNWNIKGSANYNVFRKKKYALSVLSEIAYQKLSEYRLATDVNSGINDIGRSEDSDTRQMDLTGGIVLSRLGSSQLDLNYTGVFLNRDEVLPALNAYDKYFHSPSVRFSSSFLKFVQLNLNMKTSIPKPNQFSSRLDDINPLMLSSGNPDLRPARQYQFTLYKILKIKNEASLRFSLSASLKHDDITTNRTFFTEAETLPQYNNYLTVAGATLMAPINGGNTWSINPAVNFDKRLNFIQSILKMDLGYTWSDGQTGINSQLVRNRTQSLISTANLTTNFSSTFRAEWSNTFNGQWFKNYLDRRDTRIAETMLLNLRWDFTQRLFATSSYTLAYNASSASDVYISDHVVNASLGIRLFKDRKGSLSLNAYDIFNNATGFTTDANDQYILNTWKQIYSQYFTIAFSYRFSEQR
ncbi:MAG: outer membrane beta-barrel protein [Dysgonamonadaceae bacterium]|jgi:hypothetical protein|nr:outer membrane beta-barrel protein [Dysgonamonadaceae bacterium]